MAAVRKNTRVEHHFEITGEAQMAEAHNPANGMFIPADATVFFVDGEFDRVNVGGPKLNKAGKPLKQYGWNSWDADYLDPDEDFYIPEGQELPRWLKALVYNVMRHPFAQPGDKIGENL